MKNDSPSSTKFTTLICCPALFLWEHSCLILFLLKTLTKLSPTLHPPYLLCPSLPSKPPQKNQPKRCLNRPSGSILHSSGHLQPNAAIWGRWLANAIAQRTVSKLLNPRLSKREPPGTEARWMKRSSPPVPGCSLLTRRHLHCTMGGHENLVQDKQNNRCANQAPRTGRCVFRVGGLFWCPHCCCNYMRILRNKPANLIFLVFWHSGSINNRDSDGRSQRKATQTHRTSHPDEQICS